MGNVTYRRHPSGFIVSPLGDPITSEMATHIGLDDEGGGAFVTVKQPNGRLGNEGIMIDATEWPVLRQAIDDMVAVSQGIEADPQP